MSVAKSMLRSLGGITAVMVTLLVGALIRPVAVEAAATIPTALAGDAGTYHTCVIQNDNSVACWGYNIFGQSSPPTGSFTQVSAGGYHTCGLLSSGALSCWGYNNLGQATAPAGTFAQVSAGGSHTCAIQTGGAMVCWGANGNGQATAPTGTFNRVSAGSRHTCAIRGNGSVACWGSNAYGQAPSSISGTFTQISAGNVNSCGIKSDGSLACWGDNAFAESTPPTAGPYTGISVGGYHACAWTAAGAATCWGNNGDGQTNVPSGTYSRVMAGVYHTCGIKTDGSVTCWGDTNYSQLGAAPTISGTPQDAWVDAPYSYRFPSSGAPSPVFSVDSGSLPDGLSFDPATGTISGTPTTDGVYNFSVTAASVLGSASDGVTMTVHVAPDADLSVTNNDSSDPAPIGDPGNLTNNNITYTAVVSNSGPGDASGVSLTDSLDPTTTFTSASTSQGSCSGPAVGSTGSVNCTIGSIANGASVTIQVTVRPTEATQDVTGNPHYPMQIANTATVSSNEADPTSSDRSATQLTTVTPAPSSGSLPCTMVGTPGNDVIEGTDGNDVICAGSGDDYASGQGGDDYVYGGNGNDYVGGDDGNDYVYGGSGNDFVFGGNGNDHIYGQAGKDHLYALDGVAGNDTVSGGADTDQCQLDKGDVVTGCETIAYT